MKPSVGRIVHYTGYGSDCRAAIVVMVEDDSDRLGRFQPLSLAVLTPTGIFFVQGVPLSEDVRRGGTWHWPERVE